MNSQKGRIYLITNLINNKYYVGQTRQSLNKRWSQHKSDAKCRHYYYLQKAINKYGSENFKIECLLECSLNDLDMFEEKMILAYQSNDIKFGYNLTNGGGGYNTKSISHSEETRIKQSLLHSTTGIPNIHAIKNYTNNSIIGYKVVRYYNGKEYTKSFRHTKYTLEENLNFAKEWLLKMKQGIIDNTKLNRLGNLPKYIYYYKHKKTKEIIGYVVKMNIDNKMKDKTFTNSNLSLNEKLNNAIEYKKMVLDNLRKN
jgi:group I intron endonuclease